MTIPLAKNMTADEFLAWAEAQPHGRHELVCGEVVAMAPERAGHVRAKHAVANSLAAAIKRAGAPCEAFAEGLAVVIDGHTAYEPDALVNCGERIPDDTLVAPAPVVVVEVLSPSTQKFDMAGKFVDYFRAPGIRHYLVVDLERRLVLHHQRAPGGAIATRILGEGQITLDPPGLALAVEGLFGDS
jgi:Uma2 family endonuclease